MCSRQFLVGSGSLPKRLGWNWTRDWLYSLRSPEHHWALTVPVWGSFMLSEQPLAEALMGSVASSPLLHLPSSVPGPAHLTY